MRHSQSKILTPASTFPFHLSLIYLIVVSVAFERDFSILPLSDPKTRRLQGWIDISTLKEQLSSSSSTSSSANSNTPIVNDETYLHELSLEGGLRRFPKTKDYKG